MALEKGWLLKAGGSLVLNTGKDLGALIPDITEESEAKAKDTIERMIATMKPDRIENWSARGGSMPMGALLQPFITTYYGAGYGRLQEYAAGKLFETARIPPGDLFKMLFRGTIEEDKVNEVITDLYDQGWSKERLDYLIEASRPLLAVPEIKELYLRGELGEGEDAEAKAIEMIMQHGVSEENAKYLTKLFYFIPPPADITLWLAREVFEPDMIEKYGLDDEMPVYKETLYPKAGVSEEQMVNYWRAHWQHPGLSTITELLHRTNFTEADMYEWFKMVEIPPIWRNLLIQVAYRPLTRVDVRRMYRLDVLDESGVYDSYRELGYSELNAQRMTDFTVKYESKDEPSPKDEVKELTRAQILSGYAADVIDRDTAKEWLMAITYSEDLAEFQLDLLDSKEFEADQKEMLGFIGRAYSLGIYTNEQMVDELGQLNLPGKRQEYYVAKFVRDRITKAQRPTVADLKTWLKIGIIQVGEFTEEMTIEGYPLYYIDKYIAQIEAGVTEE